jgi:hypothetical protein
MKALALAAVALAAMFLASCGGDAPETEYVAIAGGGLTYNYRYDEARAVIVARQLTPFPEGAKLEALFDVPGQNRRERVASPPSSGTLFYKLQSSPLKGLRKGVALNVTLRLIDENGVEIDRVETQYTPLADQEKLSVTP